MDGPLSELEVEAMDGEEDDLGVKIYQDDFSDNEGLVIPVWKVPKAFDQRSRKVKS
jgi:hypothetical protein